MRCWIALLLAGTLPLSAAERAIEKPLSHIAFGSCLKQMNPAPIWETIVAAEPELFIFLGDNIYADTRDPDELREKWKMLAASPGYRALESTCPILATWDDHDYGWNDAGKEFEIRQESQAIFLDFFDERAGSPRRKREGVYDCRTFGPSGRRVQIILLDTRYHRGPLRKGPNFEERGEGREGTYLPNSDADAGMLGDAQWHWLEARLREPAELRIIGSSIQLISNEHRYEKWGNLPLERDRFLKLLKTTEAQGVLILSGDRHTAEVSRMDADLGYPLYDITSSSLNQVHRWRNELNPHRVGNMFFEENFGVLSIDWNAADPVVRVQIRDLAGRVRMQVRHSLSELRRH